MSKSKSIQSEINIEQLVNILLHIINTNKQLQSNSLMPVAMNVIGDAGLGKTSVIEQTGIQLGYKKEDIR